MTVTLERHGFAPAGGGRFIVDIRPARRLAPWMCTDRGAIVAAHRPQKPSVFRTLPLTQHALTHIDVLHSFLGVPITVRPEAGGTVEVRFAGAGEPLPDGDAGAAGHT